MSDPVVTSPSSRVIINKNYESSNAVVVDDVKDVILRTLHICKTSLKRHCGPRSGYAMLVNAEKGGYGFEPNIFTRDGISIMKSLQFVSPLEMTIKDLLVYVGERIDNVARDGTTSAMYIAATFLESLWKSTSIGNLSIYQAQSICKDVFTSVAKQFDDEVWTIDTTLTEAEQMEQAGYVAYMQALSSSGGDEELATAMREIFRRSPSITWDYLSYRTTARESDDRFRVEITPYDNRIRCIDVTAKSLNAALGTEYTAEHPYVLVYADGLQAGEMKTDTVIKYIQDYKEPEPLIVIATYLDASVISTTDIVNTTNKVQHPDVGPISLWSFSPEVTLSNQPYPWELMVLTAMSGAIPYSSNDYTHVDDIQPIHLFRPSKVHWHDTWMDFYGLVEMDDSTCLHPYYTGKQEPTSYYKDVCTQLEKMITAYKEGHKQEGKLFDVFIDMYNTLVTVKRPFLRIGGTTHELVSNKDVVQDVQGACMSTLKKGWNVNGFFNLYTAIDRTIKLYKSDIIRRYTDDEILFIMNILHVLSNSVKELLLTQFSADYIPTDTTLEKYHYYNTLSPFYMKYGYNIYLDDLKDNTRRSNAYPVLQPAVLSKELLKRLHELIIKTICTNEIIVFGGVMLRQPEHKDVSPHRLQGDKEDVNS